MPDQASYCIHTILAAPCGWAQIGAAASRIDARIGPDGGAVYGAWRSQIGRPRDEVTVMTRWKAPPDPAAADAALLEVLPPVRASTTRPLQPTLRPLDGTAPVRQGNFAFRWFTLPEPNLPEFLDLCEAAWPGFEAAYDSQVVGLWRATAGEAAGMAETLLLTRRPNLAMWERSKLPEGEAESEVRAKLSRRYDLCDDTHVYTTTLLTAADRADAARWT